MVIGPKQANPRQTLYKRSRAHLLKVSSTIHYFPFLCPREKIDLTIGGFLARSHRSPLIVLSFFSGSKSHHYSPKHSSLLIFVHHQLALFVGKVVRKMSLSVNFFVFQDKKAAWFGLGRWPPVQDTRRVETPPVTQIVHQHP